FNLAVRDDEKPACVVRIGLDSTAAAACLVDIKDAAADEDGAAGEYAAAPGVGVTAACVGNVVAHDAVDDGYGAGGPGAAALPTAQIRTGRRSRALCRVASSCKQCLRRACGDGLRANHQR